jgi:hypothetical protein
MRYLLITALLLALVSPALGDTTHCTTREDRALHRWVTECSDGSRSVTRYDDQLKRFYTDVVTPPKSDKPPHGWPVPGKAPR